MIPWWAKALVAAAAAAALLMAYTSWRDALIEEGKVAGRAEVQAKWDQDKLDRAAATLQAVAAARKEEQDAAAAAAKGEKDARERAERQAAAARAAADRHAAAARGLSGDIAALDAAARSADLPTAAACPGEFARQRDAAIRARAVLATCSAEHGKLAADADAAVGELTLQLDTALGYIRALPGGP